MSQSNNKALGHIFPFFTSKFPYPPFFFFFFFWEKIFFFKASVKLDKAYKIKPVYEYTRNINSFFQSLVLYFGNKTEQSGYERKGHIK